MGLAASVSDAVGGIGVLMRETLAAEAGRFTGCPQTQHCLVFVTPQVDDPLTNSRRAR